MAELTDKELRILSREIDKQGLTYTQLQKELLDHLCCDIEAKMDEGLEFLKAFEEVRKRLEGDRIRTIQEETLLLIYQKYRMMKKFMYILGTVAPTLLILGAAFKLQHWAGASVLIIAGTFLLAVVYLPVFAMVSIRDTREKGKKVNISLYVAGVITGFIFLAGILFKIMHWPGAGIALAVSVLVTIIVFIPMLVVHALRDKENQLLNFSILIFILAMMGVNIMVFALKTSKSVLSSMVVTAIDNQASAEMIESRNALMLEGSMNTRAQRVAEKTDAVDQQIRTIMADILLAIHEKNRAAVAPDGTINLRNASYFDVYKGTEQVIFGNEFIGGKGEELQKSVEDLREILMDEAGPELNEQIEKELYTGMYLDDQEPWLEYHFYHSPMISTMNTLSNLQLKIRFLEGEVLREILAE